MTIVHCTNHLELYSRVNPATEEGVIEERENELWLLTQVATAKLSTRRAKHS